MKKLIVSAMAAIFILGTLSAQEEQKEAKSKVKYSTNINFVANWPLEARLTVTETIKVPVLNFDNLSWKYTEAQVSDRAGLSNY